DAGSATGTLTVGTGGIDGGSLDIGRTSGGADASGTVDVAGGGVALDGSLGAGNASGGPGNHAFGSLRVRGGDVTGVTGIIEIGRALSDGSTANGAVQVDAGDFTGSFGAVQIGAAYGAGASAAGSLTASSLTSTNNIQMGSFFVGRDSGGGGGTGALVVDELSLASSVSFLEVGRTYGIGGANVGNSADGTLRATTGDIETRGSFALVGVDFGVVGGSGDVSGVLELGGTLSNTSDGTLWIGTQRSGRSGTVTGTVDVDALEGFGTHLVGIASGDAGSATGTLTVGAGGISGGSLNVGSSSGGADASGTVDVTGGDVVLSGSLILGSASAAAAGTAAGDFALTAGQLRATAATVGQSFGTAQASGSLHLANVTGDLASLTIGATSTAGGAASGTVRLDDTRLAVSGDVEIALGDATGTLDLSSSLVDIAEELVLGAGAALMIDVDDTARGTGYGALDVGTGLLDGLLEITFGTSAIFDGAFFDLIVSDALDGLGGDFAAFSFNGLAPGFTARTAFVVADVGGRDVEVYRLSIAAANAVPEPGSLGLAAAALLLGTVVRQRRRIRRLLTLPAGS
ncbi:MAG: PEP-CTERM sorting domain-containing protein, partial [Gammaproteobacteria bacterium]